MKINEQIAFLRKERGITQEALANALGVTNQSVSKWEASICCPDIQLLPDIARFFGVTVDSLLGCETTESKTDTFLRVKNMLSRLPSNEIFETAFNLAMLLHDGIASEGFVNNLPYKFSEDYASDEHKKWGYSASALPCGNTVRCGNGIYFSHNNSYTSPSMVEQYQITLNIENLLKPNVMRVLYALYDLTINDFNIFVSVEEIAVKSNLKENDVEMALKKIPITPKESENGLLYRIDGSFMHIPSMLKMLATS